MTKWRGGCAVAPQQRAVEALRGKLLGRPSLHTLGCLEGLRLVFSSPRHVHHGPEGFSIARRHTHKDTRTYIFYGVHARLHLLYKVQLEFDHRGWNSVREAHMTPNVEAAFRSQPLSPPPSPIMHAGSLQ